MGIRNFVVFLAPSLLLLTFGLYLLSLARNGTGRSAPVPARTPLDPDRETTREFSFRTGAEYAYADLSVCQAYGWLEEGSDKLRSIGWLSKNRPYSRGKPDSLRFEKMMALLANCWSPVCIPRRIECPFCPIVNPLHGKKKLPWWAVQKARVDGLEVVEMQSPEAMAHVESHRLSRSGLHLAFESTSLFVPGDGYIFVTHPLMAHFIDAHGYLPPDRFWDAIAKCPPMNSQAYLEALLRHGPRSKTWAAAVWAASVLKLPDPAVDLG